jgi:hypothetical protein
MKKTSQQKSIQISALKMDDDKGNPINPTTTTLWY